MIGLSPHRLVPVMSMWMPTSIQMRHYHNVDRIVVAVAAAVVANGLKAACRRPLNQPANSANRVRLVSRAKCGNPVRRVSLANLAKDVNRCDLLVRRARPGH